LFIQFSFFISLELLSSKEAIEAKQKQIEQYNSINISLEDALSQSTITLENYKLSVLGDLQQKDVHFLFLFLFLFFSDFL